MCRTLLYRRWSDMRNRCNNINNTSYSNYGGRGITVCKRWDSFENFKTDVGNPPTPQHTLDRINNDLGYSPENCRWATHVEQARNSRKNHILTVNGISQCLSRWGEQIGVSGITISKRLSRGWSPEEAVGVKERSKKRSNKLRRSRPDLGSDTGHRGSFDEA